MGYYSPQRTIEKLYNYIRDNNITKFSEDNLLNHLRNISEPNEKVSREYVKRLIATLKDVGVLEETDDATYEIKEFLSYEEIEDLAEKMASKRSRYKSIKSIVGILGMMVDSGNETYNSRNDPTISLALDLELLERREEKLIINAELVRTYSSVIYMREEMPMLFGKYKAMRNGEDIDEEDKNNLRKMGVIDEDGNVIPTNLDDILFQDF